MKRGGTLPLSAFYFVHFASFGAFLPFFPRWLESRGLVGWSMGIVLGVAPLVGIFAPPIVGAVADALGQRAQLLRIAAVIATLAMLGLTVFVHVVGTGSAGAVAGLTFFVGLMALARAPLFGIADVIALELLGSETNRFGSIRLWGSLGFVAAALVGGLVIDVTRPLALPLAIAGLYAATIVAAGLVPARAARMAHPSWAAFRAMGRQAPFFAAVALWQLANAAYDTTYSLHMRDSGFSDTFAGLMWGLGVVAEVALMAFGAPVLRMARPRTLLAIGIAASAVRWAATAWAATPVAFALLQPMHAITFGLTWVVANAHLPTVAPEGRLGLAQGALAGSVAVGSVTGNLIWPALYESLGRAEATFGGAALCALLALAPAHFAIRERSIPAHRLS